MSEQSEKIKAGAKVLGELAAFLEVDARELEASLLETISKVNPRDVLDEDKNVRKISRRIWP